jgi:UDP-N-acetylglucosamine 2-epimerase (non-hydrolysing)
MKKIKVMSVFGTRPEAIKMAPLVLELKRHGDIESLCCVTAQHREMLDSVLDTFGIKADFDLNIMQQGQTLSDITARALKGLEEVFSKEKPDLVLENAKPEAKAVADRIAPRYDEDGVAVMLEEIFGLAAPHV